MSLFLPILHALYLCPLFSIICLHRWESVFKQTRQHRGRGDKRWLCPCSGGNPCPRHPSPPLNRPAATYPEHGVVESDSLRGGDLTGLSCCASNTRYRDCFFGVLSSCWRHKKERLIKQLNRSSLKLIQVTEALSGQTT